MAEDKKKGEIAVIEINEEFMKQKLYEFRGCKVLLDADLAEVYGYELKAFNQQVKRNIERFQNDMMFQLSDNEVEYLRSQFVTANISSKSPQQSLRFYRTRCIHVNDCTKRRTCGKTKHCIGENLQKNERLYFRKSRSYWSAGNTSVKHGDG